MRLALIDRFICTATVNHVEETTLERYSMGSLEEKALAELEQHLLLCETCRGRVTAADAYIFAMKWAARRLPAPIEQPSWNFRLLQAFAVYALLIMTAVGRFAPSDRNHAPAAIALLAMRGTDSSAHGPSGRVLVLQPDLNGLVDAPSYRLELVNAFGAPIWRGTLSGRAKSAAAIVPPRSPGVYFVHLSLPSGQLLREYSLELRD